MKVNVRILEHQIGIMERYLVEMFCYGENTSSYFAWCGDDFEPLLEMAGEKLTELYSL